MAREGTKTKPQGRKRPFTRENVELIRATLTAHRRTRDLALFEVSLDTMLRSCDLLALHFYDVLDYHNKAREQFTIVQKKTGKNVVVQLGPRSRAAVDALFAKVQNTQSKLFPFSSVWYRKLVKSFAKIAGLDPAEYSGHSTRRTKPSVIYNETRNIDAVRQLLGHTSLAHTGAYLGVDQDEAFAVAMKVNL